MSHAQVSAAYSEELHHRAPKGSANGGQFSSGGSGSTSQTTKSGRPAPHKQGKGRRRRTIPHGQLGFDGVHGTGYGMKHGDPRVVALQRELNRLGLLDMHGRRLVIDGKLGPLTTSSIRAAQRRLGMRATGIIAPAFIDRLRATKTLPPARPVRRRKPGGSRQAVHAKFDPSQPRDPHSGEWSAVGAAVRDALKLAGRIDLAGDERLSGSGRFGIDSNSNLDVLWAAIDSPRGRSFRLGAVFDEDVPKWRAANKGSTSVLSSDEVSTLHADLADAERKAKAAAAEAERAYSAGSEPTDPVLTGDDPVAQGSIASQWGPVDWSVYLDDSEPVSYNTWIKVGGNPLADEMDLDPAALAKFVEQLGGLTSGQVAASAAEPYGVEVADDSKPVAAAELRGIELARPGTWKLASGTATWTEKHLRDAARYAQRPGSRPWPVKIGHTDKRFNGDGEPALGWVENVRVEDRDHGPALIGDIRDMPDWLAAAAKTAWPYRSIEGWMDFTADDGEKFDLVGEALALLGVTPPGVSTIQSLRDLPKAVGIAAASGVRVVASMASAPVAADPTNKEADHMSNVDPVKFREALGLPASASDDEVRSALSVTDYASETPSPAPVQASLFGDEPVTPPAKPQAPVVPPGAVLVSASAWQEREETIRTLTEFVAQAKRSDRDAYIATAVKAGKFTPAQKIHFTKMWDADPDTTRAYIDSMTPNTALAVMASGYAGDIEEADIDSEFASLFPPTGKEARRG